MNNTFNNDELSALQSTFECVLGGRVCCIASPILNGRLCFISNWYQFWMNEWIKKLIYLERFSCSANTMEVFKGKGSLVSYQRFVKLVAAILFSFVRYSRIFHIYFHYLLNLKIKLLSLGSFFFLLVVVWMPFCCCLNSGLNWNMCEI